MRPLIDGEPAFRRICEAIETARSSIWATVAFIRQEFRMPEGRGAFFDILDRAVERGLDVRVIFWRPNAEASYAGVDCTFSGSQADRDMLAVRKSRIRIRWDRAHAGYCQHQKCWIIDAGHASETAFLGGININPRAMANPGHAGGGGMHDACVEVTGPSATDIHHNFVQRWNEASDRATEHGRWGHDAGDVLPPPQRASEIRGGVRVQIQRNIHPGRYLDGFRSPGAEPFQIAGGESTVRSQYLAAIKAARQSIYIENQALSADIIINGLKDALGRGVDVVVLVPAEPESWVGAARLKPENKAFFDKFASLGQHPNFTLAGIANNDSHGIRRNIYVHAKLMLIDDAWATIGSCNLHRNSLFGHSELNAAIWDQALVRHLRCELFAEHLQRDTLHLDDRGALRLFRSAARENASRRRMVRSDWEGIAFALDPSTYGA